MNRMLKTIGLALCAVFALSAVAAATASAATHHFGGTVGASAKVVANSTHQLKFTTNDTKLLSCKKFTATGLITVQTDDEMTVKPDYSECEAIDGETKVTAHVEEGNCAYVFTGETTAGNPTAGEHAGLRIEPITGATCHIELKLTALKLKCVSFPNQTVTDAVTYEQIENIKGSGKKGIRFDLTPHSIESTTTHSAACPTPEQKTVVHKGHEEGPNEESGLITGSFEMALTHNGATNDFTLTKNAT